DSPAKAKFVLGAFFNQLESHLEKVRPKSLRSSKWSDYMGAANPYERREFEEKERIVGQWLEAIGPKRTLDVGCNTGHFSRLAARAGARVVAIDYDAVVVGRTWRMASEENLDILPLRVDLSRPSPALGWCNREAKSFIDRAEGAFDSALMLAVIHHLMVGEGIPMPEIAE